MSQTYSVSADEGLSEFEREQIRFKRIENQIEKEIAIQGNELAPSVEDKLQMKTSFRLPLLEVRPEACGILRNIPVAEPKSEPPLTGDSPYFMEILDKNKYFILGYSGYIPYGHAKYGESHQKYTNSALCDFTTNYRMLKSTEWAPINITRLDAPACISSSELYPKQMGMLPHYSGHVPGVMFRSGKTFGNDTKDAKRWFRGDYSN